MTGREGRSGDEATPPARPERRTREVRKAREAREPRQSREASEPREPGEVLQSPAARGGREARRPGDGRQARAVRRSRPARTHRLLGLSSTRRAAVFALVVVAVVLSVAVPLRNYLAQRGALDDTVHQQEQLREEVDRLEQRKAQLSDPAQVEIEARDRLRYVQPGETPYIVPLPSTTPSPPAPSSPAPADSPRADGRWYGELWSSIATGGTG